MQKLNEEGRTLRRDAIGCSLDIDVFIFRRISLFTEKKAKNMERFVTAKEGDVQYFTLKT